MSQKNNHHRRRSALLPGMITAVLLLICLLLSGQASAFDGESSPPPASELAAEESAGLLSAEDEDESEKPEETFEVSEVFEETETVVEAAEASAEEETDAEAGEGPEETEDGTDRMSSLSDKDSLPAVSDSREDENFILIKKSFVGLSTDQIPASFEVYVSSDQDSYLLNSDNTVGKKETDGAIVWTWKLVGVGTGTYQVTESNESVQNYSVSKAGGGAAEVRASDMAISVPVHETTCSHTNWPVKIDGDSNVLFAATLTQGGVAVISKESLSASQRAAVSSAVLKINGPWKTPVYFYSIQEQLRSGVGFELNGATITYDASAGEIIIAQTRNWQHVATLQYSVSEASDPEIVLINTYERAVSDVTVKKTVNGALGDGQKSFDFTVSVKLNGSDANFKINGTQYIGSTHFSLKNNESVILRDIPVGAEVTVTEKDYSKNGYAASYALDAQKPVSGNTAVLETAGTNGHSIHFTNTKDVVPDTGLRLDTLPYLLILGTIASGFALKLLRRRRSG